MIDGIPDRYIGWNMKRGFFDMREVAAQKLARALQERGLPLPKWFTDVDQLVQGCVFNETLWEEKKRREACVGARQARGNAKRALRRLEE